MNLLVIRHAIAEEREVWAETGRSDDERPLTNRGRRRMRAGARGLATLVDRIDVLATSPWARAAETAEIVARAFRDRSPGPIPLDLLTIGGDYAELLAWLSAERGDTAAIVGHEPHLGGFVSWLLTARHEFLLDFKKGGACFVSFSPRPQAGAGLLRWALTPRQLRALDGEPGA